MLSWMKGKLMAFYRRPLLDEQEQQAREQRTEAASQAANAIQVKSELMSKRTDNRIGMVRESFAAADKRLAKR